tara:strand:+ start:66 stop:758 length:693 start_codon:yes stop_codon:yes gene_type:complete
VNNLNKSIDVILLCGGKGQRLRPHTLRTPKPLLLVNKKPFLFFLIKNFLKINVNQIILATGYKAIKVENFVKKYFKNNKKIKMVNSGNVDIIKRLKDSSKLIKRDFFVCYGDTYVDINLKKYIKNFYDSGKNCSVLSSFYKIKYGTVEYNKLSKVVKKFKEKPVIDDPINLGYFVFKKVLIKEIKKNKSWISFLRNISKKKQMITHVTKNKFFSFDSPREYFEIKSKFIK